MDWTSPVWEGGQITFLVKRALEYQRNALLESGTWNTLDPCCADSVYFCEWCIKLNWGIMLKLDNKVIPTHSLCQLSVRTDFYKGSCWDMGGFGCGSILQRSDITWTTEVCQRVFLFRASSVDFGVALIVGSIWLTELPMLANDNRNMCQVEAGDAKSWIQIWNRVFVMPVSLRWIMLGRINQG